ncbi:DUF1178 family protein [Microvirga thermotolerans]|uniref:DUF1178 family protein n=1 Tax=Microvirga thermotolerans TaxID=2651334 RepID=A0A5P9K1I6_9HYPH|nr:DUF1178 family protein [Microvirga thermotolerans]QFU17806.1 DUF1178 family protein [Microvirga thermotolerans]
MIKYALACDQAHEFESWFPSSEAYETQRKRGFVTCPYCNSARVEKQIMAPSIGRAGKDAEKTTERPAAPEPRAVAMLTERERQIRAMIRAVREHVMRHSENVGRNFAEEARRIHYGEAEERAIYGEADPAEARALLEEGIDVLPLPIVPDDRN